MKLSDIRSKFKNQWVLARVTKADENGQAVEVEPIAKAKTRQQIDAKLKACQEKHVTVVYTGEPRVRI